MGGPRLSVNQVDFTAAIEAVEKETVFRNWSEMQKAVANHPLLANAGMSVGSVYQYIKKFNITPKTPKGKLGGGLEAMRAAKPIVMSDKQPKNDDEFKQWIEAVRKETEGYCREIGTDGKLVTNHSKLRRARKLLDKVEKGSRKAKIAIQCIQCTAFDTTEIRQCACISCPFLLDRPWKANDDENSDIEVDDVPTTEVVS